MNACVVEGIEEEQSNTRFERMEGMSGTKGAASTSECEASEYE